VAERLGKRRPDASDRLRDFLLRDFLVNGQRHRIEVKRLA
jgi:hypothetical protein